MNLVTLPEPDRGSSATVCFDPLLSLFDNWWGDGSMEPHCSKPERRLIISVVPGMRHKYCGFCKCLRHSPTLVKFCKSPDIKATPAQTPIKKGNFFFLSHIFDKNHMNLLNLWFPSYDRKVVWFCWRDYERRVCLYWSPVWRHRHGRLWWGVSKRRCSHRFIPPLSNVTLLLQASPCWPGNQELHGPGLGWPRSHLWR